MKSVIVYESMFGSTHAVAEAIAAGISDSASAIVVSTSAVSFIDVSAADLLIVGGPTHSHGMSSASSRRTAVDTALQSPSLDLDESSGEKGLRDWFWQLPRGDGRLAVAFDTRINRAEILTGSAARGIGRRLRLHGYSALTGHESFLLDGNGPIPATEIERARLWGQELAAQALRIVRARSANDDADSRSAFP